MREWSQTLAACGALVREPAFEARENLEQGFESSKRGLSRADWDKFQHKQGRSTRLRLCVCVCVCLCACVGGGQQGDCACVCLCVGRGHEIALCQYELGKTCRLVMLVVWRPDWGDR